MFRLKQQGKNKVHPTLRILLIRHTDKSDHRRSFSLRNNSHLHQTPSQKRDHLNADMKGPEQNLTKHQHLFDGSQQGMKNITDKLQDFIKVQLEELVHFVHKLQHENE